MIATSAMNATLTVFSDAGEFLRVAADFLKSAPAATSMIAMPAARMLRTPNDDDAGFYLATVESDGAVVAAACHGNSGGALLSAAPDAAVSLIARDMAERGRRPGGVVAPLRECEVFSRDWCESTGASASRRFQLRHFELTSVPAPGASAGRLRVPEADEHALIASWHLGFIEDTGIPDDPQTMLRHVERRIARGLIRVWDVSATAPADGARGIVSFAGFGVDDNTARIAPVYTPPALRGRGYATAMVAELARELFAAGKQAIYLTTDVANPTSNSIYQRIGFLPVVDHFHFDFTYPSA